MMILKYTEIPPIAYQDYPIDIILRIRKNHDHYDMEIMGLGYFLDVPIGLTSNDLAALSGDLQKAMLKVAQAFARDEPPTNADALLEDLAETGKDAYNTIFSDPGAHSAMEALRRGKRKGKPPAIIEIVTEDFFLPWETLYPVSLDEPVSGEHFWGMNYVISRVIVQNTNKSLRAFINPTVTVQDSPTLGLCTYNGLSSVKKREIPFFEHLQAERKIQLSWLRPLDATKKQEEFQAFKVFWQRPFNLGHFACHAEYDCCNPRNSNLLLSNEFSITLKDLSAYDFALAGHPLITMNACETGIINPLYTSDFAAEFLKYGAIGVVATECRVPDSFAADFADQLYTHLLAGETLGESLLAVRWHFWNPKNPPHNPSGLLYAMYASPAIRFQRTTSIESNT